MSTGCFCGQVNSILFNAADMIRRPYARTDLRTFLSLTRNVRTIRSAIGDGVVMMRRAQIVAVRAALRELVGKLA